MTLPSNPSRDAYSGNGSTTVFAYTFRILDDDEIKVVLTSSAGVETVQTKTTHYTVSGVGNSGGGNVTMVTAPASGENLTLTRSLDIKQEADYTEADPFPAETHEQALDRAAMVDQQQQEEINRCLKFPISLTGVTYELPVPTAGYYLGMNSGGTALEWKAASSSADILAAALAAQAGAEAAWDSFDDTYLGAKASDPSVDNDGDALAEGMLYYNSTSNVLKYYNGSAWVNAASMSLDWQYFSSSGTWTKPTNARLVRVICVGAGAGGGSGRLGAAGSARYGGGGGAAGRVTEAWFDAGQLSATETITIGAAGTGGAAQSTSDTNGNAGTAGGNTYFGGTTSANSKLMATGGAAGGAGTAASGTGGASGQSFAIDNQRFSWDGGDSSVAAAGESISATANVAGSGGAGGGISTGNTGYAGGAGGGAATTGAMFGAGVNGSNGGAAGGASTPGADGGDGAAVTTNGTSSSLFGRGGGGGGSGYSDDGGAGGDGSAPGGGGGGGGASVNSNTSGAGGNGAAGGVYVISYI